MLIQVCLLLLIVQITISTTSIKTFPTVNLRENVPIHTKVINLMGNEEEMKKYKLILLNLGGFETNLFEIKNENILTKNEIDREQLLGEKRCFDRLYCLIEVHILVNDGQEYWVIPIHIIDENDNKPQFKNSLIELKFELNNLNEYKIPFEGAIDIDEGKNGKIFYLLDCSNDGIRRERIETTLNCFPLFDLIIFSSSLINQNDQLGIKLNPSSNIRLLNEYEFILFAFNLNEKKEKEQINSIQIKIKIEKFLEKPKFIFSEFKFVIKHLFKGQRIGKIDVKSNIFNEKIIFKILNKTKDFEINSMNGELILLNPNLISNHYYLLIESFYLINSTIKSSTFVQIFIRSIDKLNQINYQINQSSLVIKNQNQFIIKQTNLSSNQTLFNLRINSLHYPQDQFHLSLFNYRSLFSLSPSLTSSNNYLLKLKQNSSLSNSSPYLLIIQIKHQLTNEYLSNLTIKLIFNDSSSTNLCLQNTTFDLYQINKTKFIAKIQVIETNLNIFSFSTFFISKQNPNELIIDQCRMNFDEIIDNETLNQSNYELCSDQCFQISLINQNSQKMLIFKRLLKIRPIEMAILCLSLVFSLATITLIIIICRLRGFHLCLSMKNYLFYGKKYGLNRAQRLSSAKITERVHSIVVRESRSPSIQHIKSLEPYIFNINQYFEQEKIPSVNLYPESSPDSQMPTPLSCTSSLDRGERTISNVDQEMKSQMSSSSILPESKQLLQMITPNDEFDLSRLASEV